MTFPVNQNALIATHTAAYLDSHIRGINDTAETLKAKLLKHGLAVVNNLIVIHWPTFWALNCNTFATAIELPRITHWEHVKARVEALAAAPGKIITSYGKEIIQLVSDSGLNVLELMFIQRPAYKQRVLQDIPSDPVEILKFPSIVQIVLEAVKYLKVDPTGASGVFMPKSSFRLYILWKEFIKILWRIRPEYRQKYFHAIDMQRAVEDHALISPTITRNGAHIRTNMYKPDMPLWNNEGVNQYTTVDVSKLRYSLASYMFYQKRTRRKGKPKNVKRIQKQFEPTTWAPLYFNNMSPITINVRKLNGSVAVELTGDIAKYILSPHYREQDGVYPALVKMLEAEIDYGGSYHPRPSAHSESEEQTILRLQRALKFGNRLKHRYGVWWAKESFFEFFADKSPFHKAFYEFVKHTATQPLETPVKRAGANWTKEEDEILDSLWDTADVGGKLWSQEDWKDILQRFFPNRTKSALLGHIAQHNRLYNSDPKKYQALGWKYWRRNEKRF